MTIYCAEGFQAVYYACPHCAADNTIRYNLEHGPLPRLIQPVCRKCRNRFDVGELMKLYLPDDVVESPLFNLSCIEYFCEACGRPNITQLLRAQCSVERMDQNGTQRVVKSVEGIWPTFAKCAACSARHTILSTAMP